MFLVLFSEPVRMLFQDFLQFLDATGFFCEFFPKALSICFPVLNILVLVRQGKLQGLVLMFKGDNLFHEFRIVLPFYGGFKDAAYLVHSHLAKLIEAYVVDESLQQLVKGEIEETVTAYVEDVPVGSSDDLDVQFFFAMCSSCFWVVSWSWWVKLS